MVNVDTHFFYLKTTMRNGENSLTDLDCLSRILSPPKKSSLVHKISVDLCSIVFCKFKYIAILNFQYIYIYIFIYLFVSHIFISVLIFILFLYLFGKPFQRGFNCDDDSIRYPYLENTISSVALYFYSTLIPFFVVSNSLFFFSYLNLTIIIIILS